jgi:tetratricopeptide (TPR) repeat protein
MLSLHAILALTATLCAAADEPAPSLRDINAVRAAYASKDWKSAAEGYSALAKGNPRNGDFWYRLGVAQMSLKKYREAIEPFEKAASLGHNDHASVYNIVACYAQLGEKERAFAWLEKGLRMGLSAAWDLKEDKDLEPLRSDPRFKRLAGIDLPKLSRNEQWRYDIDRLVKEAERLHYKIDVVTPLATLRSEAQKLTKSVPKLEDHEVIVGIQRWLALIGDGHTFLFRPREGKHAFHHYAIDLYRFKEGFFVASATETHKHLLGKQVVSIGDVPIEQAFEKLRPVVARDNEMGVLLKGTEFLAVPEILHAQRVIPKNGAATFTFGDGTRQLLLPEAHSITEKFIPWRAENVPLYLQQPDNYYWSAFLPDSNTYYIKYNAVANKDDESLAAFVERAFKSPEMARAERLVLDLRHNNGGNGYLIGPLVNALIASRLNERGKMFCIVGRKTYSAAMMLVGDLAKRTQTIFVGEPTGQGPNFIGEIGTIFLPYSGLTASASNLFWQNTYAQDHRIWIAPELLAEPSAELFRQGRDPAMEAILERGIAK